MTSTGSARSLVGRAVVGAAAMTLALGTLSAAPAAADSMPAVGVPTTVSADALPTWQINGVVWQQATAGNIVYAVGSFTKARPAGVAVGGVGEVDANNVFAYDITTGNRVEAFNHQLNAQAESVAVSPDGTRVYIGGDFTTVDGISRSHIAAFNTATQALDPTFRPVVDSSVQAISVTPSTVYIGGNLTAVAGTPRSYLAAVAPGTGALLPWAPVADAPVTSMVAAPGGTNVVIGGRFTTLNGVAAYGLGSVDPTDGTTTLPFAANANIRDAGTNGAITSLRTDGTWIYGSGYSFSKSQANFEGTFSADPTTGTIRWANDCHGDTYDVFPQDEVVYAVGHTHTCEWIGAFKNSDPWTFRYGTAYSKAPSGGVNVGPDDYGWNFNGIPTSSLQHWFPTLTAGKYTGQDQAGWSISGNSNYVSYGGEFLTVNGTAQQGLVRFAKPNLAPNKNTPIAATLIPPTALSTTPGEVRVSWGAAVDRDNQKLTYKVYRDSSTTPFYTVDASSNFWTLPSMSVVDTGLAPGSVHTYKLRAYDPYNNYVGVVSAPVTVATAAAPYAADVVNDGATNFWRLGEATGTLGYDYAGSYPLTINGTVTRGAAGAAPGDADTATSFDGTTATASTTGQPILGPNTFSLEAWIKTTTTTGGKIVGFGSKTKTSSGSYDRHIYMDNAGRLLFGVSNSSKYTIQSVKSYNDGNYHHVVATLGSNGMTLYVDGKKVGTNGGTTIGQNYSGYWRVGGDNLTSWANKPTSNFFNGVIDDVAVYPSVLTPTQVRKHAVDGGRTLDAAPSDSIGTATTNALPDAYWRLNETSGSVAADSSGNGYDATYVGGVTLGQASTVSGATGTAVTLNGSNGTIASSYTVTSPSTYTASAWFKTTTTRGGKILGLGNATSGSSGTYDRNVYMGNAGRLYFSVNPGTLTTVSTPTSYNDGRWHQVVVTQNATDGMRLYVDGLQVASNAQTKAKAMTGYWRVGGDNLNGLLDKPTSAFLAGSVDEVAVWGSSALSASQVLALYKASPASTNLLPTASIATPVSCTDLTCTFDASASADRDGTIASYAWSFGDSTTATGATSVHKFPKTGGTFPVTMTVTDNEGATATATTSVTVVAPPNQAPTASLATPACSYLSCTFDGSASADADGTVASYAWDFGDGSTGTGATPSHVYAPGTYTVSLVVTDDQGAVSAAATRSVTAVANVAPTAAATGSCTDLDCSLDASASVDTDGTIASYAWDFGDGSTGSGKTASHTYAAGTYTATVTVTDDQGATSTATTSVTATVPPNKVPNAVAAAPVCTLLSCSVDATGSSDPDGSIASYAWDFGDGSTATGATATHAYTAGGSFTITLTVTDDQGATATATRTVTVTPFYAADAFGRSVVTGWGSADLGGSWTTTASSNFAVAGGVGTLTFKTAGSGPAIYLPSVASTDTDVQVTVTTDKPATGGGMWATVSGRRIVGAGEYRAKVHLFATGAVAVSLVSVSSTNVETTLKADTTAAGLTYAPGTQLRVRVQVTGASPTTLRAKVWKVGTPEPAAWTASVTDSTAALQAAGSVGLLGYLAGSATNAPVVVSFDDLQAGPTS